MYYIKIKVALALITLKLQCRYKPINKVAMIILLVVLLLNVIDDGRIATKSQLKIVLPQYLIITCKISDMSSSMSLSISVQLHELMLLSLSP